MLLAKASTACRVSRALRTFATVVETSGFKVAAVDRGEATSAITVLVKAGSRFEPTPGVANALKNFAFKSTAKRSALGTVRESELYGGVLTATLSREHLALTTEFLRGDEHLFADVLTSFLTSAKFTRHEFEEYVQPVVRLESKAVRSDPATWAVELAHAVAFRSGLGSSVFAPIHNSVHAEDVKAFATSSFRKGNIAVLGTGIDQTTLSKLVEKSMSSATTSAAAPVTASPTSYFGGETRVEAHGGPQTIFVGFGTTTVPSANLAALAAHLHPQSSVKWSQGISPIAAKIPLGSSVRAMFLPYSDATLFGLLVQGETGELVKEAGKIAVNTLKDSAAAGLKPEEVKKAVAKAKFAAASAVESSREGFVSAFGAMILAGSEASLDATFSSLDKVTPSGLSKATSTILKSKPTYVAVGDLHTLPYTDELGL